MDLARSLEGKLEYAVSTQGKVLSDDKPSWRAKGSIGRTGSPKCCPMKNWTGVLIGVFALKVLLNAACLP